MTVIVMDWVGYFTGGARERAFQPSCLSAWFQRKLDSVVDRCESTFATRIAAATHVANCWSFTLWVCWLFGCTCIGSVQSWGCFHFERHTILVNCLDNTWLVRSFLGGVDITRRDVQWCAVLVCECV